MTPAQSTLGFIPANELPQQVITKLQDGFEIDIQIAKLQEQIADLEKQKEVIIQEHLTAGQVQEGPFTLETKVKKIERLDPDLFFQTYPTQFHELFLELGETKFKPSKPDAAKVLTSYQIEKVCKKTETVTHVIKWDPHQGAEP
jgi:hypothetical protein